MTGLWLALVAVYGSAAGSYLGVVVDRLPAGRALVSPSRCGHCGRVVRARDNIPVLAYVLLRGRCRDCDGRIEARWWLVEVALGALWVVSAAALGAGLLLVVLLVALWLGVLAGWLQATGEGASVLWSHRAAAALPVAGLALLAIGLGAVLQSRWLACATMGAAGALALIGGVLLAPGERINVGAKRS